VHGQHERAGGIGSRATRGNELNIPRRVGGELKVLDTGLIAVPGDSELRVSRRAVQRVPSIEARGRGERSWRDLDARAEDRERRQFGVADRADDAKRAVGKARDFLRALEGARRAAASGD